MREAPYCRIPLLGHDGTVRACAKVDEADAEWVAQWTWRLVAGAYAGRTVYVRGENRARIIYLHRALFGLEEGDARQVDHVQRDLKLDNRRSNLRVVTTGEQAQNRPSPRNARSPYRGVCWDGQYQRWYGNVSVGGKRYRGPRTTDQREAAEWARRKRAEVMTHAED